MGERRRIVWLAGLLCWAAAGSASAQSWPKWEFPDALRRRATDHLDMQTLGGRQFWGDVQFFQDWRIQRNVFTGHYRLLDGGDWRHAWGTLEDCQTKLAELRREKKLAPMSGKGVILVHGIMRSSKSMSDLAGELRQAGYTVFSFDYPSSQVGILAAAEYLDSVIRQLDGIDELHLVCHSMGGLIVRAYFAQHRDPRIRRVVMLGTPNTGAELADLLCTNLVYRVVFGPAGQQLVTSEQGLIPQLPAPPCEFAVIAGGRGTPSGWNPLIPGDDDGTVAVARTRLPGASDFIVVPAIHSFLPSHPEAMAAVVRFLEGGRLRASGERQPLPSEADAPTPSAP